MAQFFMLMNGLADLKDKKDRRRMEMSDKVEMTQVELPTYVYEDLVRDAKRWRHQQMGMPDGWTSVRTAFYNELLAKAQIMDPGEIPHILRDSDGAPTK